MSEISLNAKDWIVILIPIVTNLLFFVLFYLMFFKRINKMTKKAKQRFEELELFMEKLTTLKATTTKSYEIITDEEKNCFDKIHQLYAVLFDIIEYYDCNRIYLNNYSKEFNRLTDALNKYIKVYSALHEAEEITEEMQYNFELAFKEVINYNNKLTNTVKKTIGR